MTDTVVRLRHEAAAHVEQAQRYVTRVAPSGRRDPEANEAIRRCTMHASMAAALYGQAASIEACMIAAGEHALLDMVEESDSKIYARCSCGWRTSRGLPTPEAVLQGHEVHRALYGERPARWETTRENAPHHSIEATCDRMAVDGWEPWCMDFDSTPREMIIFFKRRAPS